MKLILSLAFPLIISQLINMTLVLTDVWMMSRLSVEAIAAGGLGAAVYNFVIMIAASIVGCVANLIAIAFGKRATQPELGDREVREAVKGGVLMAIVLSAVSLGLFAIAPQLLIKAQQPAEVVDLAMVYLDALKWTAIPGLMLLVFRGLTSAFGSVRSIMVMSLATIVLNVPISYVLAFTFGMGLSGLGLGSALAAAIVMLSYGIWVFSQPLFAPFSPWLNLHEYRIKLLWPLAALGLPIGLASLLEHVLIYGGTLMAGTISITALALHQILLQCLGFTWNINFGLSQAAAILVGRDFGAGNIAGIKRTAIRAFGLVSGLSLALAAVFIGWPESIVALFNLAQEGEAVTRLFYSVLLVVALSFIVDAWQLLAINLLRGMKIVMAPTVITGIGYWLCGLPAAWWLMGIYGLGGIWAGIGIGLAITGVLLLVLLLKAIREQEHPRVVEVLSDSPVC
uniref:MATE family efflux transporter n=1 Tax=Thaumasiovibrio occultus TaxID=1891184 RepID=UPI000B35F57D|nr:MATE family efflux transporter [Thaumasiovibrio occultus]